MIDQQLLVPTLPPSSGQPSITIAELVALMDGGVNVAIDQTLLIPTLKGCAGLAAERIVDIVALASLSTRGFILAQEPEHYYSLSQKVGSLNFGDAGVGPVQVPIVNAPTFANSVPMADEPGTTAALFDGVDDHGVNTAHVDNFDTGTMLAFVNFAALAATGTVFGQQNAGGATLFAFQFQSTPSVRMFVGRDGTGTNFYNSVFDLTGLLTFSTWHLVAARQAGAGVTWFIDGLFFDVTDAEVTESTLGNLDNTAWSAETLVAAAPADRLFLGANAAPGQLLDGQAFNVVSDDVVWTNQQLTDLWNLALGNGLNG